MPSRALAVASGLEFLVPSEIAVVLVETIAAGLLRMVDTDLDAGSFPDWEPILTNAPVSIRQDPLATR